MDLLYVSSQKDRYIYGNIDPEDEFQWFFHLFS